MSDKKKKEKVVLLLFKEVIPKRYSNIWYKWLPLKDGKVDRIMVSLYYSCFEHLGLLDGRPGILGNEVGGRYCEFEGEYVWEEKVSEEELRNMTDNLLAKKHYTLVGELPYNCSYDIEKITKETCEV